MDASFFENRYCEIEYKLKKLEKFFNCKDLRNKKIIDVGCWWGWFIRFARERGATVEGFDYAEKNIEDAKKLLKNDELIFQGDANNINKNNDEYDIVFCSHVIEHLEKEELFLKEAYRILKQNGEFWIIVPNDNSFSVFFYKWCRMILNGCEKYLKKIKRYYWLKSICYGDDSHFREYSKKKILKLLSKNQFEVKKIISNGMDLPYPLKNRLSYKLKIFFDKHISRYTPGFFRAEWIIIAKKKLR
ncbi:MAG: class I SAM-dependent methyltransferase [Candidatus Omnitrophica bacterium]|nr:class I SAM-dependent methyltransferase [Candidatus Omnitrophota bacterium]